MIRVNGEEKAYEQGMTLMELIEKMSFMPQRVAVEINLEIIPKNKYEETIINDNDEIEIVAFMGGGSHKYRKELNQWKKC